MPTLEELLKEYNAGIQKNKALFAEDKPTAEKMNMGFSLPSQERDVEYSSYDINQGIGEDVENRRSRNQGFWDTLGIGTARLAGKTLTKTAESAGFIGGLLGIDNRSNEYGGGVSGWIAGAADNGLAVAARELEQNL